MAKILIVDDDETLVESLKIQLTSEQHLVDTVSDGLQALEFLKVYQYDVIILDWQMPGIEGIEVCRRYRESGGNSYIIMLTGQSASGSKERGLDTGADDYMTKPFVVTELSARIRAVLRRPIVIQSDVLKAGPLICDPKARKVILNSTELKLAPLEFTVLEFFLRHSNEVFSGEALLQRAWTSEDEVSLDSVYTCIARLRKKLDKAGGAHLIQNIHGVGYKFVPPSV